MDRTGLSTAALGEGAPAQGEGMTAADLSIREAGARLRDGRLSAVGLLEAHLARIARRDPAWHAFAEVTADRARAQAADADAALARGEDRGPLHGIPVGVKDLIDVAGVVTACGSRLGRGRVAAVDSAVVARLRAAGAVLVGKLATDEFGLGGPAFDTPFPPVRNPWNVGHVTGGSSSGPAAAVAGGLVRSALGTDTGGSIRTPAAYCGVVGLKPGFGRVPLTGIVPLAPSLDHVGPLAATVAEAALTLDAIADPGAPAAASRLGEPLAGLRLGYARGWCAGEPAATPGLVGLVDAAVGALARLGADVAEAAALPDYRMFESCGAVILYAEAAAEHQARLACTPDGYGRLAARSLAHGATIAPDALCTARRLAGALRDALDRTVFARLDALLTATALTTAPPFAAFDGAHEVWPPVRAIPFNVTGHPALTVPAGWLDGLPVGLQIVGPAGGEARICQIGDAFERAAAPRPPLPG
jgi:aspartyl-tRNA(Asn)/glutamyl-tRNA(Gln) amidotransferase subunit A